MQQLKPRPPQSKLQHQTFTIFTKTAVARILGVKVHQVKEVRVLPKMIWVYVEGQRPRFISKSAFNRDYLEKRIAASAEITVEPLAGFSYQATNLKNGHTYRLWCIPGGGLQCECADFERQKVGGKVNPTCKHRLAVQQWQDTTLQTANRP